MDLLDKMPDLIQYFLDFMQPVINFLNHHPIARFQLVVAILIIVGYIIISAQEPTASASETKLKEDLSSIAGGDIITTQLDLAKAYIEMKQKKLARSILKQAIKQGSTEQQIAARQLLKTI